MNLSSAKILSLECGSKTLYLTTFLGFYKKKDSICDVFASVSTKFVQHVAIYAVLFVSATKTTGFWGVFRHGNIKTWAWVVSSSVFLAFITFSFQSKPAESLVCAVFFTGQNAKSKDVLSNFSDFISRNPWFRFCLHFSLVTTTVTKLLSKSLGDPKRL